MQYSIQEVAELVGKTRQTIYKYTDEGKLSFTLSDNGTKLIEMSEILRVFPEASTKIMNLEQDKSNVNAELKLLELEQELTKKLHELEITQQKLTFEKEKNELLNNQNKLLNDFNTVLKSQLPDLTKEGKEYEKINNRKKGFIKKFFK